MGVRLSPLALLRRASTWIAAQTFSGDMAAANVTVSGLLDMTGTTSLGMKKVYSSAEQTITAGGTLTIAHGLGVMPKNIRCFLRCKTAELGWSVNNETLVDHIQNAASNYGVQVWADATNVYVQYGLGTNVFTILKRTATAGQTNVITAANWRFMFHAWG